MVQHGYGGEKRPCHLQSGGQRKPVIQFSPNPKAWSQDCWCCSSESQARCLRPGGLPKEALKFESGNLEFWHSGVGVDGYLSRKKNRINSPLPFCSIWTLNRLEDVLMRKLSPLIQRLIFYTFKYTQRNNVQPSIWLSLDSYKLVNKINHPMLFIFILKSIRRERGREKEKEERERRKER